MSDEKELVQFIHQAMADLQRDMAGQNAFGKRIAARTLLITRTVLGLLLMVSAVSLFFIYDFTGDMRSMITNMVSMYKHFGDVSSDMHTMTASVQRMGGNVAGMPVIADEMVLMSNDMGRMGEDVGAMRGNVVDMSDNLHIITAGVSDMSVQFDFLGRSVHYMGYNVNQMAQPVRSMDPFRLFFPH